MPHPVDIEGARWYFSADPCIQTNWALKLLDLVGASQEDSVYVTWHHLSSRPLPSGLLRLSVLPETCHVKRLISPSQVLLLLPWFKKGIGKKVHCRKTNLIDLQLLFED